MFAAVAVALYHFVHVRPLKRDMRRLKQEQRATWDVIAPIAKYVYKAQRTPTIRP